MWHLSQFIPPPVIHHTLAGAYLKCFMRLILHGQTRQWRPFVMTALYKSTRRLRTVTHNNNSRNKRPKRGIGHRSMTRRCCFDDVLLDLEHIICTFVAVRKRLASVIFKYYILPQPTHKQQQRGKVLINDSNGCYNQEENAKQGKGHTITRSTDQILKMKRWYQRQHFIQAQASGVIKAQPSRLKAEQSLT